MELERKKEHLTAVEREMKANENALAQRDTEIVRMKTGINSFSVLNCKCFIFTKNGHAWHFPK